MNKWVVSASTVISTFSGWKLRGYFVHVAVSKNNQLPCVWLLDSYGSTKYYLRYAKYTFDERTMAIMLYLLFNEIWERDTPREHAR